jgi:hypothetical protein
MKILNGCTAFVILIPTGICKRINRQEETK